MTTYLTIITTALVLTQIIRLWQNAKQIRHIVDLDRNNKMIIGVYQKLEKWLDTCGRYTQKGTGTGTEQEIIPDGEGGERKHVGT